MFWITSLEEIGIIEWLGNAACFERKDSLRETTIYYWKLKWHSPEKYRLGSTKEARTIETIEWLIVVQRFTWFLSKNYFGCMLKEKYFKLIEFSNLRFLDDWLPPLKVAERESSKEMNKHNRSNTTEKSILSMSP